MALTQASSLAKIYEPSLPIPTHCGWPIYRSQFLPEVSLPSPPPPPPMMAPIMEQISFAYQKVTWTYDYGVCRIADNWQTPYARGASGSGMTLAGGYAAEMVLHR